MTRHTLVRTSIAVCLTALAGAALLASAAARDAPGIVSVSIVQLLANPADYHGRRVRVVGYLHDKFEDSAIYLSKGDADYLNGENGLWVSYAPTVSMAAAFAGQGKAAQAVRDRGHFDCKMVLVEGVFDKDGHGHGDLSAGELKAVDRLVELTRWFDGGRELVKP